MAFEDWRKAVGLEPLLVEQTVWSREHAVRGHAGPVARLDTRALLRVLAQQGPVAPELAAWLETRDTATAVIDFKTGKAIYGEAIFRRSRTARARRRWATAASMAG